MFQYLRNQPKHSNGRSPVTSSQQKELIRRNAFRVVYSGYNLLDASFTKPDTTMGNLSPLTRGKTWILIEPNNRSRFDQHQKEKVGRLEILFRQLDDQGEFKVLDARRKTDLVITLFLSGLKNLMTFRGVSAADASTTPGLSMKEKDVAWDSGELVKAGESRVLYRRVFYQFTNGLVIHHLASEQVYLR
ncbi:hypothetical protein EC957_000784 [Mortierella hygrophila]|uniref:Uncharacterized protein n=1 Tax=Mortierella hygrophila TaxID=979708 RepID=A0A9P6K285_9FUNG|nr:hypothetical protein EC957_000784 [Mortierella hygrophila]